MSGTPLIELQERISRTLPAGEAEFLQLFSNRIFDRAGRDFLEEFSPETLQAMALGALKFLGKRNKKEILVRVYNPSLEGDGWETSYTVLEIALKDRPFIVDSVRACLRREGAELYHFLHPILGIERDSRGDMLRESLGRGGEGTAEAYELFLVQRLDDPQQHKSLEEAVRRVLNDVVLATDDYKALLKKAREVRDYLKRLSESAEDSEIAESLKEYSLFLQWLLDENFIFLGYREYDIKDVDGVITLQVDMDSGLGILRKMESSTYFKPTPVSQIQERLRNRVVGGETLLVTKSNAESTVHRSVRMDYIGVKKLNAAGEAAGEKRILGLFTSKAHSTPVEEIPIIRRKLRQVLDLDHAIEASHDFKQMVSIFNSMPREELFWSHPKQLHQDIRTIMSIEQERGVRVTVRPDPLTRGLAMMVIMPRDRFNSEVRRKIQQLLTEKLQASQVDYQLAMGEDEEQVRFHFFFTTGMDLDALDLGVLNEEVAELTRSWDDQLLEELTVAQGAVAAQKLMNRYEKAFDEAYKAENQPSAAVRDIDNLEKVGAAPFLVDLIAEQTLDAEESTRLKIYHQKETLTLSEVFPILENMGLTVLEQISYRVIRREGPEKLIQGIDAFRVLNSRGRPLDVESHRERVIEALVELLNDRVESDRINCLVLEAALDIRQVALLSAYRSYLSQISPATSRRFVTETLLHYPACAAALHRYFEDRFLPGLAQGARSEAMARSSEAFRESLNAVSSLPEDETLRTMFQIIEATVRTNFFLKKAFISLKIRSDAVERMPEPRPLFEIVVTAPGVEGIHLRGGKVARGGIRWSDRPDDFRTEVLGLMKTQMTKNAVIVPVGSKGGFILKKAPTDRETLREYVKEQYSTFVRGLLDLTDNIIEGKSTHPEGLVIYDDYDAYLVVAADKGTATFSDIANEISQEYSFWLGDAFASGGSHGYDHKKEGITARGAWECVSRHFRELGIDVGKTEFSAVGIGDMAGDVFGNGMLYTDRLLLKSAFNHRHIFLDPNPDAKISYEERRRLFNLPRSSWEDYNRELISPGGGVFTRGAKSIPLSAQVKEMLKVEEDALSGQDLIRRILKMAVDLLWNGGIGTYVKASSERHSEVGDPANDGVRIDATELGAKVIGEGGNLGLTQKARIEYALRDGRLNTDAIDNSAGVDMSDHEVNIKILLQPLVKNEELSFEKRNQLLKEMTEEVNQLVLQDNYTQSLALSLAQRQSRQDLGLLDSLIEYLTERGALKPATEFLPDAKTLGERSRQSKGLTRPELAILLAYTKMGLNSHLLTTSLPDEHTLQHYLYNYFPSAVSTGYGEMMSQHPLRREIIACQLTNTVVDKLGMTFVHGNIRDSGATPGEVTRAALATLEILDLNPFWERIFALDNLVPAEIQYKALRSIVMSVEGIVHWILLGDLNIDDLSVFIERYREPLLQLRGELAGLLPVSERKRYEQRRDRLFSAGIPEALAVEIASLDYLPSGMGVIDVSHICSVPIEEAAKHFYAIGDRLSMGWLRDHLHDLPKTSTWETIAAEGLIMDLRHTQRRLTINYLQSRGDGDLSLSAFLAQHMRLLKRYDQSLWEVRARQLLDLTSGTVLARLLSQMGEQRELQDWAQLR